VPACSGDSPRSANPVVAARPSEASLDASRSQQRRVGADEVAADPQLGVMGLQAGCDDGLQAVDDDVEGTQVGCGVREDLGHHLG